MDAGRRAFLSGRLFSAGARPAVRRATKPLGPFPPCLAGAPPEAAGRGTDCASPCVRACPSDLVRIYPDNHEQAGLPYLSFESGGCDFCGDCIDACPVELDAEKPLSIGVAELRSTGCLTFDGIVCMACRFVCEFNALAFDLHGRPSVVAETCSGCGACVGSCPSNALTVPAAHTHRPLNEVPQ